MTLLPNTRLCMLVTALLLAAVASAGVLDAAESDLRGEERPLDPAFGADVEAFQVGFLREAPSDDVACALLGLASEPDALDLEGRELSWKPAGRLTDSPLGGGLLERTAGMPLTVRNVNTVHRLLERFAAG